VVDNILISLIIIILIVISIIDLKKHIISNLLLLMILILVVLYQVPDRIWIALAGMGIGILVIIIPYLINSKNIGEGDVKLMAVCGLLCAWPNVVVAIVMISLFITIIGVTGLHKQRIAFAPFISCAMVIALFAGDWIVGIYLDKLGVL